MHKNKRTGAPRISHGESTVGAALAGRVRGLQDEIDMSEWLGDAAAHLVPIGHEDEARDAIETTRGCTDQRHTLGP